jgi:hypothetical protein
VPFRRSWGYTLRHQLCRASTSFRGNAPVGRGNLDARSKELNSPKSAGVAVPSRHTELRIIMRSALTKVVAVSLSALLVGATATTSEAAFAPRMAAWHGGGWHGGGWHGGGWHGGWHGYGWGPALGLGILGGAIAGSLAAPYAYGYGYGGCYQDRPVYSPAGIFLGNQLVNVCY